MSSFEDQLQNRLKKGLRPVTTKLISVDGQVTTLEKQGTQVIGNPAESTLPLGFIPDLKPDLSVAFVLPWLCVTSQDVPNDATLVETHQITHIVSLLPGFELLPDVQKIVKAHKVLSILDECNVFGEVDPQVKESFEKAADVIESIHSQDDNNRVLVHCNAGLSRAPTLALTYLILHEKLDFDQAWKLLKSKREQAKPNISFWNMLKGF